MQPIRRRHAALSAASLCLVLAGASSAFAQGASSAFMQNASSAFIQDADITRAAPRVTNGLLTQQRPTAGALLSSSGNNHSLICSGTLIGCQTFLTAAHCVCNGLSFPTCGTPLPSQYSVYLQNAGIVGVSAIDVDPSYNFGNQGDVAVFTLSSPITGVPPTPLNTSMRPPFGTTAEIVGFGLTKGSANDTGMLRRGLTETDDCLGSADGDTHVCWNFLEPLGVPGEHSNTCNGDSGGPLFADLGAGQTVIGITSGGDSADCLPTDNSYDSDVYVHRAFIESVGGVDLLNTTCGSISQVGEPATTIATFDFDLMSKSVQSCRKAFSKMYSSYVKDLGKAVRECFDGVNDGSRTGPCPDAEASEEIASAESRVDVAKLASKCDETVIPSMLTAGVCAGAADAADLAACIFVAGDAAVSDAVDSEYADSTPTSTIGNEAARDCQKAIAKAGAKLLKASLKAKTKCQVDLAAGKLDECPDAKALESLTEDEGKAESKIVEDCTDAAILALDGLDPFGGSCAGVTNVADLVLCHRADHAAIADELLALLEDDTRSTDLAIAVAPGYGKLRFVLNGRNNGVNDLDIYAKFGSPASPTSYGSRSENGGVFEEIEIDAPIAGTWYAHVARFSGDDQIPYQLTVTAFAP